MINSASLLMQDLLGILLGFFIISSLTFSLEILSVAPCIKAFPTQLQRDAAFL